MPTPLQVCVDTKEPLPIAKIENEPSHKEHPTSDPDGLKPIENYQKKKQQQPPQQQQSNLAGSPRRKFVSRSTNTTQNVGRHSRNSSLNKRSTSDTNNNNNISGKQFNFKVPNLTQPKMLQSDYQQQQKLPNGHVEPSKKAFNKFRSITKNSHNGLTPYDDLSSHSSAPEDSSSSTSPNLIGDVGNHTGVGTSHSSQESDSLPRKYSMDFLHQVGYKYSNASSSMNMTQQSPKSAKQMDDANLLALKIALGDNSGYYNHFYASSMYGSQMMLQHHQQQQQQYQQSYSRFQQSQQQQQQQHIQRLQRLYQRPGHDNYQRIYQHQVHPDLEPTSLPCHCPQLGQNPQRGYQPSYTNSPSFQNRNKPREFRDNTKKNQRAGYSYQNGANHERNYKSNKDHQHRNGQLGKSHSFNEDDSNKRKGPNNFSRMTSEEQAFRSLSPTPPGSSKSSSPGALEKINDKDTTISNGSNFELVDDSASTASASSSSGPSGSTSYISDMKVSLSAPILLAPEEPTKNVNLWIDNNFGSALHNGLSLSAEHLNLNFRDAPITIIKRPPSANGGSKRQTHHAQRNMNTPSYDPQYPFDYYLARSEESEMRIAPHNLRCSTKWDRLSEDMWKKFQIFQQTRQTYHKKMVLWRDLYNSVKNFPLFQQKAFPKWGLYLVGSTISGFGSDTSDIDMCLVSKGNYHSDSRVDPRMEAMVTLNDLKNFLTNSMSPFQNFSLINAKVPILRFRDASNKIEIDLNYNNCVGVRNTHLLFSYSQLDWRLRPLALIVKLWAQYHNINDARNSTISSYSLVLMTIHFLQYAVKPAILPCLHQLCPDNFRLLHDITTIDMVEKCDVNWKSENRQPLGELFVRFLDYFSNFDYANHAISIRTGGVLPIEECKSARSLKNDPNHWQTLCIEEPFDLTNTARSAYDGEIFLKIKDVFFQSFYRLKESRELATVFKDPLFTQNQQQYMSQVQQMKYMTMSSTSGAGTPAMAPLNDVRS